MHCHDLLVRKEHDQQEEEVKVYQMSLEPAATSAEKFGSD